MTHYSGGKPLNTGPGAGITGGTGTVCHAAATDHGNIVETNILIDLTGLNSDATLGDIIGVDATTSGCYIARFTETECGTHLSTRITCLEAPATGEVDIDLYAAAEATGVTDGAIGDLDETVIVAAATDWTAGATIVGNGVIDDGEYLYLTVGTSSTPTAGTYTAGKFLITIFGYRA